MDYVFLWLFANNFYNYAFFFSGLIIATVIIRFNMKLIRIHSSSFYFLCLGSLSYGSIYFLNYGIPAISKIIITFFAPIFLFYYGYCCTAADEFHSAETMSRRVFVIGIATFFHGTLNVFINRNVDLLSLTGRAYNDIYGGILSATLQNLFFVIPSALLFFFIIYCNENKLIKAGGIMIGCMGVYGSLTSASRTIIFVTIIAFFVSLYIYLRTQNRLSISIVKYICIATLLIIIVLIIIHFDLFSVQEKFLSSALGERTGSINTNLAENDRWEYAYEILRLLPSHLGGKIPTNHYAHNLWVDVAKQCGVLPFLFLILFAICSMRVLLRLFYDTFCDATIKIIVLPAAFSLLLVFFTEPIMEGMPLIFCLYCVIIGLIDGYLSNDNEGNFEMMGDVE